MAFKSTKGRPVYQLGGFFTLECGPSLCIVTADAVINPLEGTIACNQHMAELREHYTNDGSDRGSAPVDLTYRSIRMLYEREDAAGRFFMTDTSVVLRDARCFAVGQAVFPGRLCANKEFCQRMLHRLWPSVYCTNLCALEDA